MHVAAAGVASMAVVMLAALASPPTAQARVSVIGEVPPVVGEVLEKIGSIGKAILNPAEAVLSALLKVLQAVFGGFEAKLITGVINGLLAVPSFTSGHVAGLEDATAAIAVGMLGAALTLAVVRYYLVGLASGIGGFEAVQGVVRVVVAAGFIILWREAFNELVQIPALFDGALLGGKSVQHSVALLFDAALVVGSGAFALNAGIGLIFVVLIAFFSAITFIALLWMKVLLSVLMMFLFVAMPLCVAIWPVPEFGWLAVAALRVMFVGLLVPCVWAILFALSSAVNADVLSWAPSHSIVDTVIIRPLAGITLMLLCISIPRFLVRTAMIGPHGEGGGRAWRTLTFGMFALRGAAGVGQAVAVAAAEGHPGAARVIAALPSQFRPPEAAGEGNLASRVAFGRSGFVDLGEDGRRSKDHSGGSGTGGRGTGGEPEAQEDPAAEHRRGSEAADAALRRDEQSFSVPGIERPAYDREAEGRAWKAMHARAQMAPPSSGDVASAMASFAPETQRGIAAYQQAQQSRMRTWAARHLAAPGLSDEQRSGLLTLGSAHHAQLEEGINHALFRLDETQDTATGGAGGGAAGASTPKEQAHGSDRSQAQPDQPRGRQPGESDSGGPAAERDSDGGSQPLRPPSEQPPPAREQKKPPVDEGPDPEPFLD